MACLFFAAHSLRLRPMLSQRARYAMKALLYLADHRDRAAVQIGEIAEAQAIPRKFLELILLDLKKAGMVESSRGKAGGYRLSRPSSDISFGEVIRLFDGPLALVPCASVTAYKRCADCADEATCAIRKVMTIVRDSTATILEAMSLDQARGLLS